MTCRPLLLTIAAALTACTGGGATVDGGPVDAAVASLDAAPNARFGCPFEADRPGACPGRGLYDAPLTVELRADYPTIRYTLDGSAPTSRSPRYQGPITIAADRAAVTLRALATDGVHETRVATHTYVFPARVAEQPARPAGFPAQWTGGQEPTSNVTGASGADGPGELWQALLANARFRARFSERAVALLPALEASLPNYLQRGDEVEPGMAWESARRGDYRRPATPYGVSEWRAERQRLVEQWFPMRGAIVRAQLAARGL